VHHYPLITELIFILAASVLVSAAFHRLRLPPILGYLTVGVVLGPAIGLVTSVNQFNVIAELGVAFLLFTLGLEFSLPRLLALRRVVFGMGSLQVLVSVGLFVGLIYFTRDIYGITFTGALVAASAMALSSTAIVTKELSSRAETATVHGNLAIGILLFQDIAAIVMLVLISVGGDVTHPDFFQVLLAAAFKALVFFVAVILVGKWVLPPLFFEVGKTKSEELFMLCVLVVALASAAIAENLGLSMALGAFMAGMMLGESHFRYQIETEIRPFRDVLLGVFFVSVGLKIDLELITTYWPRILFFTGCLILFKTVLITTLCRVFGYTSSDALRTGLILSQGGEFGFALLALAVADSLLPGDVASFFCR
jgi:Kef-type K+ transport systems, membrane components